AVAVSEAEMPHLSRLKMRGLRDTIDADYILYSIGSGYYGGTNGERALASGQFEKLAERPGLVLLRRTTAAPAPPPVTPPVTPSPPPATPPARPVTPPPAPPARPSSPRQR